MPFTRSRDTAGNSTGIAIVISTMRPPYSCNESVAYLLNPNSTWGDPISNTTKALEIQQNGMLKWIQVWLYAIVFILATLGNVFVVATLLGSKRMSSVTNYFLLSLSISDLMVALVCIPITTIGRFKGEFIFGEAACKVVSYLMYVSVAVSTFTLVAISIERYCAICRPFQARSWQTKSHALKVIIVIWVFSCLLSSPRLVFERVIWQPIARLEKCIPACRPVFTQQVEDIYSTDRSIAEKIWYISFMIVLLGIPGIVMAVAYGCVCRTINQRFYSESKHGSDTPDTSVAPRIDKGDATGSKAEDGRENGTLEMSYCQDQNGGKALLQRTKDNQIGTPCDRSKKTESTKQLEEKKKVVQMLIVIVICFFVCWTPITMANVWKSFDPRTAGKILRGIPITIFQILMYVSCCINPIVYCFLNKRFRRAFRNAFSFCLPKRFKPKLQNTRQPQTSQYSAVTLTTKDTVG